MQTASMDCTDKIYRILVLNGRGERLIYTFMEHSVFHFSNQ